MIFGSSCLSLEYALAVYDLLPEAEYTCTFVTFDRKKREVENHFGRFSYRDMPPDAYSFGILFWEENGYIYRIASPKKPFVTNFILCHLTQVSGRSKEWSLKIYELTVKSWLCCRKVWMHQQSIKLHNFKRYLMS